MSAWIAPDIYYNEPSAEASKPPTSYATGIDLPQQNLGNSIPETNDVDITAAEQPRQPTKGNVHSLTFNPGDPAPTANTINTPDTRSEKPVQPDQQLKPRQLVKRVPAAAITLPSPTISIRTGPAKLIRQVSPIVTPSCCCSHHYGAGPRSIPCSSFPFFVAVFTHQSCLQCRFTCTPIPSHPTHPSSSSQQSRSRSGHPTGPRPFGMRNGWFRHTR